MAIDTCEPISNGGKLTDWSERWTPGMVANRTLEAAMARLAQTPGDEPLTVWLPPAQTLGGISTRKDVYSGLEASGRRSALLEPS